MEIGKFKLMIGTFGSLCIIANGIHEPIEIQVTLPPPARILEGVQEVSESLLGQSEHNLKAEEQTVPSVPETTECDEQTFFRIRDAYNSPVSQIGAYYNYEAALATCPEGFCIFDQNGTLYYTG